MSITFLVCEVLVILAIGFSFVVWTFIEFEKEYIREENKRE